MANKSLIKNFKIKNFLPFYIEKVNHKFFSGTNTKISKQGYLKSKKYKTIAQLDPEEAIKFKSSQAILDHNNIRDLLNQIIWKINDKTGSADNKLFVPFENKDNLENLFVIEKHEFEDLKVIGDNFAEKRYIYCLDINRDSYLYNFIEQIELAFVIDEKKKNVSGGFSLNCGHFNQLDSFEKVIKKFYLNSMTNAFITNEIYPLSVYNILGIMDLITEDDFLKQSIHNKQKILSKTSKQNLQNKKTLNDLKKSCKQFVNDKIFKSKNNFSDKEKKDLEQNYLFAFLNIVMCCLALYEELKNYFENQKPEIYISLLHKLKFANKTNDYNCEQDFLELANFLKTRFYDFDKEKLKKIDNPEEALDTLINFDKLENESFGPISVSYELNRNCDKPFLNDYEDIFINSKELKIIFLLAFNSNILGINLLTLDFVDYAIFLGNIKKVIFDKSWDDSIKKLVFTNLCEWNYNYVTFVDANFSGLIIKNDDEEQNIKNSWKHNSIDYQLWQTQEDAIYNNYLWSFIYGKTLIWRLQNIEEDVKADRNEAPWKLRDYLNELESLRISELDDFYGILQVKNIVNKIDSFFDFNKLNKFLKDRITKEDKLFGKGKERKNLAATFVSAAIFGILDFFTMIFSVLTVTQNELQAVQPENIVVISIGSVFAVLLFAILIYIVFVPIIRRNKKNQYY